MINISLGDIKRLISKSKKITNIDKNSYHKRIFLSSMMSSPTVDIEITRTSGPFSSIESLKISYSSEEIFVTTNKSDVEFMIEIIKTKEKELKDVVIEKKKQDFLKLIED